MGRNHLVVTSPASFRDAGEPSLQDRLEQALSGAEMIAQGAERLPEWRAIYLVVVACAEELSDVRVQGKWVKRHRRLTADEPKALRLLTSANDRLRDTMERRGGLARALEKRLDRNATPKTEDGRRVMSYE